MFGNKRALSLPEIVEIYRSGGMEKFQRVRPNAQQWSPTVEQVDVLRMPPEVSQRISVRHGWSRGAIDVSNAWAVLLHSFGPHTPFKKYGPALGCTKGKIRNDIRAADGTGHCLTKLVFLVLWPRRVFFTVVRCCCSSLLDGVCAMAHG